MNCEVVGMYVGSDIVSLMRRPPFAAGNFLVLISVEAQC
jgi:hypothetical protein